MRFNKILAAASSYQVCSRLVAGERVVDLSLAVIAPKTPKSCSVTARMSAVGGHKMADRLQDALIDFILSLAARFELAFGNEQRMVSAFDDVQFICRCHFSSNGLQNAQGAQSVTGSLYEQGRRRQCAEHLGSQLRRITPTAKRVTKADNCSHIFFQCDVASDPRPEAFSD